mmetsp:Transcript_928/g.2105  ORF Transcript_928/g.2105 Transcript_928/m.2105 type:complete len:206 (-) Transcript_928:61-678(-)
MNVNRFLAIFLATFNRSSAPFSAICKLAMFDNGSMLTPRFMVMLTLVFGLDACAARTSFVPHDVRSMALGRSGDMAPNNSNPVVSVKGIGLPLVTVVACQYRRAPCWGGKDSIAPGRKKKTKSPTSAGWTGKTSAMANFKPLASAGTKSVLTGVPGHTTPNSAAAGGGPPPIPSGGIACCCIFIPEKPFLNSLRGPRCILLHVRV